MLTQYKQRNSNQIINKLNLEINLYTPGLLQVLIKDPKEPDRFRVSDYNGVEWGQLILDMNALPPLKFEKSIVLQTIEGYDTHKYIISLKPFRIEYFINETSLIKTNYRDLLYFEAKYEFLNLINAF